MAGDWKSRSTLVTAPQVQPDYLRNSVPASDVPDPDFIAGAADYDTSPGQATEALDISSQSGASPGLFADNVQQAVKIRDRIRFASQLAGKPALSAWAARSPQHAAAVRHDAGPLGRIEGWLSDTGDALKTGVLDIGQAEAMREYMGSGGPLAKNAVAAEQTLQEYDAQKHSWWQQIVRAAPQMALYGSVGYLTGGVGVAGLMYLQNKGTLARQIQQAQPAPPEVQKTLQLVNGKLRPVGPEPVDDRLSDDEIDQYATAGSMVGAVTLAGMMGPMLRSLPGFRQNALAATGGILSRAAATSVGAAAIRALGQYGKHTLMGAMGMAFQHTLNSGIVQNAAGKEVDLSQLAREGAETFLHVLPVAAAYSGYGPFRDFMEQRGKILAAGGDQARLNDLVEQAQQVELAKRSPNLASDLFGVLGRGALRRVFVGSKAAATVPDIAKEDVAAAEAQQGDVEVPMQDYLSRMSDVHDSIKDDVRTDPEGYSVNEAREAMKDIPEEVRPADPRDSVDFEKTQLAPDQVMDAKGVMDRQGKDILLDTTETKPLHEKMAEEYGGTPEQWGKWLTPDLLEALNQEGSVGAISPEEHAAARIENSAVESIDPAVYKRNAAKSEKAIRKVAEKAVEGSVAGANKASAERLAVLNIHEMARDLNLALAKKAEAVKAEMSKALGKLTSMSVDQKLRAQLQRAGGPLLHLFDAITEGVSASPLRQGWVAAHQEAVDNGMKIFSDQARDYADARVASALDEAEQWFEDSARPYQFDERALRRVLDKPKPFGELIPADVRNIMDAVKQLATTAREEQLIRSGDSTAQVTDAGDEIRGELKQNPDKGLPLATGIPSGRWRDLKADANAANAVMLRPKNNLRQKSTAAVKWIFDRINQAVYSRDELFRSVGEMFDKAWDSLPKDMAAQRYDTYDLSKLLPVQGVEPMNAVPRQWVWSLARHWMSAGNVDRITSTTGWDRGILSSILFDRADTKLSVPEWDYLQSLADVNENYVWPKLKEHFEKFYGMAPPKVAGVPFKVRMEDGTWKEYQGGYNPLKRDARPGVAPQAEPTKGIAQYWGRDFQTPWTPGSAKERIDNSHYLVNMDWDSSQATLSKTLHWLAFDQPVRDVAKLLNYQPLAADMNQYMGQGRAQMVQTWLKASATRQAQSVPEGMEIVGKAFGWQRKLALMQIVGGSARLASAQLSHPAGLMLGGEVNPVHGIPALLSTFKPFTMENGEVRLFPNWNDAADYGKEVSHRADNAYASLRGQWDKIGQGGNRGPLGALRDVALKTAGIYLHAVDRLTTTWAWNAFHNQAVSKFKYEPYSKEATDYADSRTQDVMPVHDLETAAPILTNRQIGGFLIMHGFKNTLYNMRADAINSSVRDFSGVGGVSKTRAVVNTIGRVGLQAAMFGGFAIMGKLALGYGQQEDETKGDYLARTALGGQTDDIPLIGGIGEIAAKWFMGGKLSRKDFEAYSNPGVAAIAKTMDLIGKLVNEGREDYKKVFDALEYTLFMTGVPSKAPRVTAEHLYQRITGEDYDPEDGDEGRYVYSEKQWDSIKRTLSPDED